MPLELVVPGNDWLQYPECSKGIGEVIRTPTSAQLISGVQIVPGALHPDDRGFFMEIMRMGTGIASHFDPATTQVSAALSYPGTIKAFHYHLKQTDYWVPSLGMFQVALVDLRKDSPTFGLKNTLYVGQLRPWQILIPPGVGHGYKIIGNDPSMLVYVTNKFYDPKDEGRIAHNNVGIHYDWETQYK
ncbi:MAG: dTDP-4-dehydrorhamnose 3,5-epimerase family protein [Acidobacteriota bacterium]